ncbi:hypothetical protein A8V38_13550 [Vibrio parahaemolyticus]|nr:hypothetical protein [Vibrio parahaemolyticus]
MWSSYALSYSKVYFLYNFMTSRYTKEPKYILSPEIIDKARYFIDRWLDLRVKHRNGMNFTGKN